MRILHFVPAYNLRGHMSLMAQTLGDYRWALDAGHEYDFRSAHSCDLNWLRNHWLDVGVSGGYDLLYMQDADCYATSDRPLSLLVESLEATDATVVAAAVPLRTREAVADADERMREAEAQIFGDVFGDWLAERDLPSDVVEQLLTDLVGKTVSHPLVAEMAKRVAPPRRMNVYPWHQGRVFECEKVGTGMVLIDLRKVREWYADRTEPCFWRTYSDHGVTQEVGQDIWFTRDIVRGTHGGKVVCDGRISTTHVDATHEIAFSAPGAAVTAEPVNATAAAKAGHKEAA